MRILVERYDDTEVISMLPRIYKKQGGKNKIEILDMLMRYYRSGGPLLSSGTYRYFPVENKLVLRNLRLRKLSFISGFGLKDLILEKCIINDSRVLSMVKLESLSLANSSVKGIDELKTQATKKVDVSGTNLLSHSFLANQRAEILDLSNTQLSWFTKLSEAENLKTVILSPWHLKTSSVKNLKNIEVINKESLKPTK